jgi:hypothetical protein
MLKRNLNVIVKATLIVILVLLFILLFRVDQVKAEAQEQDLSYTVYYDIDATKEYLGQIRSRKAELKILEAKVESDLEQYTKWEEEYYFATKVFEYFMQRGFTKEATCAIIGNMMIETSGGTLDLKPDIYSASGNYYGLCQWSLRYYPETEGLTFRHQLNYLFSTMPWEFNTFGWLYEDDFNYEDFIKMTDVKEAALAFAKGYERCGQASYGLRQKAAEKAYNYFTFKHPN